MLPDDLRRSGGVRDVVGRSSDQSASDIVATRPLVLVVEDDPDAAELMSDALRRSGCDVLVRADGEAALEAARELPAPDLVLLDLELPGMSGREVLRALKSDVSLSWIPIVIVSAAAEVRDVHATDHIAKHELLDGLARVVRRLARSS